MHAQASFFSALMLPAGIHPLPAQGMVPQLFGGRARRDVKGATVPNCIWAEAREISLEKPISAAVEMA
jgi:hypothetical protein